MHYYLIHGIDPIRKSFMEKQFQLHGIQPEEVTWINYPNKNDYITSGICIHPGLTKGQIACTYKHYLALKDIVEKDLEFGVIMEDNIQFVDNIPTAIKKYLEEAPDDWDIIWDSNINAIHEFCSDALFRCRDPIVYNNETIDKLDEKGYRTFNYDTQEYLDFKASGKLLYKKPQSMGANFYIVNKRSAKLMYENFLPFNNCSDHHYNDLIKKYNLNSYIVAYPNVDKLYRQSTWKDEPTTDSTLKDQPKKFIWNRK